MNDLTIGQVAERAGVGVETIRFYEREGLIKTPPKGPGFRYYSKYIVAQILFIRRAKELDFSLKEIKELLALRASPDVNCAEVRRRAEAKITDIEERIRSLQKIRRALGRLAESCVDQALVDECPILEALASEERNDAHR